VGLTPRALALLHSVNQEIQEDSNSYRVAV